MMKPIFALLEAAVTLFENYYTLLTVSSSLHRSQATRVNSKRLFPMFECLQLGMRQSILTIHFFLSAHAHTHTYTHMHTHIYIHTHTHTHYS